MPKTKTRKSVTNRFKITKNGKVMRRRSFSKHLKAKKSAKRINKLSKSIIVKPAFAKRIRKALGITLRTK